MANSKAQDLKNSYVNGIIDGMRSGKATDMAGLAEKMGSEVGQQASTFYDIRNGAASMINDGNPTEFIMGPQGIKSTRKPYAAYPLDGQPHGANSVGNLINLGGSGHRLLDKLRSDYYSY